jgi:hypothetical protein
LGLGLSLSSGLTTSDRPAVPRRSRIPMDPNDTPLGQLLSPHNYAYGANPSTSRGNSRRRVLVERECDEARRAVPHLRRGSESPTNSGSRRLGTLNTVSQFANGSLIMPCWLRAPPRSAARARASLPARRSRWSSAYSAVGRFTTTAGTNGPAVDVVPLSPVHAVPAGRQPRPRSASSSAPKRNPASPIQSSCGSAAYPRR